MTLKGLVATIALALCVTPSVAQDYPTHPIKIVVPLPPGATADTLPRIVADKLQKAWGQPVTIENRPGAAQNLGAEFVARAEPDGYTLLATPQGPLTISQSLFSKLGFDPTAFTPITVMASLPYVLVANPSFPANDLKSFLATAKTAASPYSYASPGVGSSNQLAMEWLKSLAGLQLTHVPYLGAAPALIDVLGGHVPIMFDNAGNVLSLIKDGKLKTLAVTSKTRMSELPDVPAIAEIYPEFVATSWFAVVAPPKTPAAIAKKLNAAIVEALHSPDATRLVRDVAGTVIAGSTEETAAFFKAEATQWRKVIDLAGVKLD
jgi:tripartite-type tricarboxylate transporter receptor subunit TctC